MRKISLCAFLLLLVAANVFAHAGEVHKYMGTITMLNADGSFGMKTTAGKELTVATSKSTTWVDADGHAAKPSDLAVGTRVVVTISKDGKTASAVRIGAARRK